MITEKVPINNTLVRGVVLTYLLSLVIGSQSNLLLLLLLLLSHSLSVVDISPMFGVREIEILA
jgi:hypothetical protein